LKASINKLEAMETPNYIIRIPEPCHEDWNKMTPDDKGKFCNSCSKSVVDFTDKTDEEIISILQSSGGERVCGHFRKSQVNRPLVLKVNLRSLPKNMSATRIFAVALLMVFGSVLVSCYDHKDKKINGLEVVEQKKEDEMRVLGGITMPVNVPTEDSVKTEETVEVKEMLMGDVEMVCPAVTGQSVIEVPPPPENFEYIKGKSKIIQKDSVPEEIDSTLTEHRLKGEIEVIRPETSDTTKTAQKDSTERKKTEYNYLGKPVMTITKKAEEDSSKTLGTTRENLFIVYPNPAKGEFTLKYEVLKRTDMRVDLLNENGSLIRTIVNVAGQYEGKYQVPVNVNDLPNGIYLVAKTSGGTRETKRVIVEK
jgi:hypothetical protein